MQDEAKSDKGAGLAFEQENEAVILTNYTVLENENIIFLYI